MASNHSYICIYCAKDFHSNRNTGDHIIPAALGVFENDPRLKTICPECNQKIGTSEEQLIRCGPESLLKRHVEINNRRSQKRGNNYNVGAKGAKPPQLFANFGEVHYQAVPIGDNPHNLELVDQIVLKYADGLEYSIQIHPGMDSHAIKMKIVQLNTNSKLKEIRVNASDSSYESIMNSLAILYPEMKTKELNGLDKGTHSIETRIDIQVTDHYFRAIAKIAFHYYIVHNRRGHSGNERIFDSIKNFIMNGGNGDKHFYTGKSNFHMPYGTIGNGVITPNKMCHYIAVDERHGNIMVLVHLFVGKGIITKSHIVILGKTNSIIVPNAVHGSEYVYEPIPKFDGVRHEAQVISNSGLVIV